MKEPLQPQASVVPEIGDIVDGKFAIEQLIGQGGMGAVFVARHLVTGKRAAIKFLLPSGSRRSEDTARFMREARAAILEQRYASFQAGFLARRGRTLHASKE